MTAAALIQMLQKVDPGAEVKAFDADTKRPESIGGMIYGGKDGVVELLTHDDPDPSDESICGLCGLLGADKIPQTEHWPGEQISDKPLVHAECEADERERAHMVFRGEVGDDGVQEYLSKMQRKL